MIRIGLFHTQARRLIGTVREDAVLALANYYTPKPWLILDGDVSWSRARFTEFAPVGDDIPGAVATVVSGGATLDSRHHVYGSLRLRYFGPRSLVEDNSVRSDAGLC